MYSSKTWIRFFLVEGVGGKKVFLLTDKIYIGLEV